MIELIIKRKNTWIFILEAGIEPHTKKRKQVSKSGFKTKGESKIAAKEIELQVISNKKVR